MAELRGAAWICDVRISAASAEKHLGAHSVAADMILRDAAVRSREEGLSRGSTRRRRPRLISARGRAVKSAEDFGTSRALQLESNA